MCLIPVGNEVSHTCCVDPPSSHMEGSGGLFYELGSFQWFSVTLVSSFLLYLFSRCSVLFSVINQVLVILRELQPVPPCHTCCPLCLTQREQACLPAAPWGLHSSAGGHGSVLGGAGGTRDKWHPRERPPIPHSGVWPEPPRHDIPLTCLRAEKEERCVDVFALCAMDVAHVSAHCCSPPTNTCFTVNLGRDVT